MDVVPSANASSLPVSAPKRFSPAAWLLFNLRLGGLTFGFGSITPMYERALVQDTQALTREEFQETLTLAQVLPGPSLVSMTMYLGQRLFGTPFALLGVVCLCLPGALWAALVVRWVPFERPLVQHLMQGFAVGAAVLLADFIRRLWPGIVGTHVRGELATRAKLARRAAVALGVTALIVAHLPMFAVVLVGIAASVIAEFSP